ncbi:hypothetical protein N9C66_08150 [Akkermansiaceae bacterium]|nr:hypothetical protein [Akkermansiaceae bacterium]MDA9831300.1 hypothetical protein [Akkermansiaceae bacterium]
MEVHFEPVAIYNNAKGKDAKILKEFKEAAWNYQVIRFITHEKEDIIPRRDKINTVPAVAARMIATLEKKKREVPEELRALVQR